MNFTSNITAMSQRQPFNPWEIPDTFTVYEFASEDVRSFLHPHWKTQKAPHPAMAYLFGLIYFTIGFLAISGNWMVLSILSKFKHLRTPANILVMNLAISDLLLMLCLIPEAVFNFFTGGPWKFGAMACQIHAFSGALMGYSQINTLMLISWDRYNVIVNGIKAPPLTMSKVSVWLVLSWIWAFGWALSPLVGWGYYTVNGMLGTCAFDGMSNDFSNKTHILASSVFLWLIPIVFIVACYVCIVKTVFHHEDELRQQAKKMNVASLRNNAEQNQTSAEIRIAKVAIINVTLWIIAWTPFTIVCCYGTWVDTSNITAFVDSIPIIFAKSSCCYNPIIYALSHPKYRECLKELYPWLCIVVENKKSSSRGGDNVSSTRTEASEQTISA